MHCGGRELIMVTVLTRMPATKKANTIKVKKQQVINHSTKFKNTITTIITAWTHTHAWFNKTL